MSLGWWLPWGCWERTRGEASALGVLRILLPAPEQRQMMEMLHEMLDAARIGRVCLHRSALRSRGRCCPRCWALELSQYTVRTECTHSRLWQDSLPSKLLPSADRYINNEQGLLSSLVLWFCPKEREESGRGGSWHFTDPCCGPASGSQVVAGTACLSSQPAVREELPHPIMPAKTGRSESPAQGKELASQESPPLWWFWLQFHAPSPTQSSEQSQGAGVNAGPVAGPAEKLDHAQSSAQPPGAPLPWQPCS